MASNSNTQDPDDVLDYKNDWATWLDEINDTISASTWSVNDADLNIDSSEFSDTETVVWISGGVVSTKYSLTNHIVTAGGREKDKTRYITIKEQ